MLSYRSEKYRSFSYVRTVDKILSKVQVMTSTVSSDGPGIQTLTRILGHRDLGSHGRRASLEKYLFVNTHPIQRAAIFVPRFPGAFSTHEYICGVHSVITLYLIGLSSKCVAREIRLLLPPSSLTLSRSLALRPALTSSVLVAYSVNAWLVAMAALVGRSHRRRSVPLL